MNSTNKQVTMDLTGKIGEVIGQCVCLYAWGGGVICIWEGHLTSICVCVCVCVWGGGGALTSNVLSGEPDYFGRNKILSGYDLSHYQVPHCIRVFFYFVWFVFIHHNFILNYVPIVTFWIFTYHKIWILLIIFCFIWSYWIIYFSTSLEVFWSVVS